MAYDVTLVTGDGTGPELAEVTRKVIEATGVEINWDVQRAGTDVYAEIGKPMPEETLESIRKTKVALKAPITTPVGTGFRSVNVALRQTFDLYACVRPCKSYKGVRSRYKDIDLVVVRENTEDIYAGIEFEKGKPETLDLIKYMQDKNKNAEKIKVPEHTGISIKPISIEKTERIVRYAFEYAKKYGRKKVTHVHKANIMKYSDGLWKEVAESVAKDYPEIEFEERLIDNMCMQLVQKPEIYDVIVTQNLYGDILSDLCAGLVGGLGVAPGMNVGTFGAIFEATHGSAPKYKGQYKVNPVALILSGRLMLRYLGEEKAAAILEQATAEIIAEGKDVTYDLKDDRDDPTAVGTDAMGDAIIKRIHELRNK